MGLEATDVMLIEMIPLLHVSQIEIRRGGGLERVAGRTQDGIRSERIRACGQHDQNLNFS